MEDRLPRKRRFSALHASLMITRTLVGYRAWKKLVLPEMDIVIMMNREEMENIRSAIEFETESPTKPPGSYHETKFYGRVVEYIFEDIYRIPLMSGAEWTLFMTRNSIPGQNLGTYVIDRGREHAVVERAVTIYKDKLL